MTAGLLAGGSSTFAQSTAKVSGSVIDQVGGLLPYVTVALTHRRSQAHYETRTDQIGHFEIEGLAAGEYLVDVQLTAFAPVEDRVTLSTGEHLQQNITLQLGAWEERIVVTDADPPPVAESGTAARDLGRADTCERSAIGGDVRPPVRLHEIRPTYPRHLRSAAIQGAVVVAGRIGSDGRLQDSRVLTAAHPDLAAAAVAAIAEWQWSIPRLDCVPVDGHVTVTVEFKIAP